MPKQQDIRTGPIVFFALHAHLVFVTKYRRHVLDARAVDFLRQTFTRTCTDFGVVLVEMDSEDDHVHLLVNYRPQVQLSKLVNSLKGVSSRLPRVRPYLARRLPRALYPRAEPRGFTALRAVTL